MESREDNDDKLTGLKKLAAKFQLHRKNDKLNLEEMEKFVQLKFTHLPSGTDKRKTKRSCMQWPWAADKHKSSILFGDALFHNEQSSPTATSKRYSKYPWSHQHKSKALDFGSMENETETEMVPKSQYKADYVLKEGNDKAPHELRRKSSRNSNHDKRSLSDTNIRVTEKQSSCALEAGEHQQRWTLKTLEKKPHPTPDATHSNRDDEMEKETQELFLISQLSIDEALKRLREETKETNEQSTYSSRPF